MGLKFVRSRSVLDRRCWRLALRLRPKRVAQFAAFPGPQTVKRQPKRDSNQPGPEAVAVSQAIEPAIGA